VFSFPQVSPLKPCMHLSSPRKWYMTCPSSANTNISVGLPNTTFEIRKITLLWIRVVWNVTPCRVENSNRRFGRSQCLHLPWSSNLSQHEYTNKLFSGRHVTIPQDTPILYSHSWGYHVGIKDRNYHIWTYRREVSWRHFAKSAFVYSLPSSCIFG
jgi:hypothetical protein